ncbi:MAG: hypothetical protein IJF80_04655 [Clostridia bacterium]|nr:hypothetical protein [Clostridia bacterium]
MGKAIYRAGVVVSGNYSGRNIYKYDDSSFMIVSNDENGKIIINSLFPTNYLKLKEISRSTVERFEDVSSSQTGANPSAIAKGLFWAGPVGGLLGAAASQSATFDLAIYFKDGTKSLIRILNSTNYQELKSALFVL